MENPLIGTQPGEPTTLPPSLEAALRRQEWRRWLASSLGLLLVPILAVGAWSLWTTWQRVIVQFDAISKLRAQGALVDSLNGQGLWWGTDALSVDLSGKRNGRILVGADLAPLGRLRGVEMLDLHNNPEIGDADLAVLANLTELRELYLGGANAPGRVTDAALKAIRKANRLESLDLTGTQVTDSGLSIIRDLPGLRTVVLTGTKVTPEGIAALKDARMDLAIETDLPDEDAKMDSTGPTDAAY